MDNQWIIVAGSMGGGFFFHGPFPTPQAAEEYAHAEAFGTYEISELAAPVTEEESER